MRGGRILAASLRAQGASTVFGLCGDHVNAIFDGMHEEGVRIVDTRGEAGAAHMAEGWSLATGAPGACVVTGGPGFTNALTALAGARLAGTPMVLVTSNVRRDEVGRGFPQDMAQMPLADPVSVWSRRSDSVEALSADVADAFAAATSRRGPAVLEVPLDLQLAEGAGSIAGAPAARHEAPKRAALDEAAKVLGEARRPVAIAGEGCHWSGAAPALRRIAEAGIPVFTVRAGRGLLPDDHEMCFGQPNYLRGAGVTAFAHADALLVAGCDLDIVLAFGALAPQAPLVRLEIDEQRARSRREPAVAVAGNEAASLAAIADRIRGRERPDHWIRELRRAAGEASREASAEAARDGAPAGAPARDGEGSAHAGGLHPARLVSEACAAASAAAGGGSFSVSIDAGELALWALEAAPATGPGRFLSAFTTPLAPLGPGIPYAIAARLARPDEPSLAIVGDGALGFSAIEIDTAARHGVDVVVAVGNDAAWGIVERQMQMGFGRAIATGLAPRDYATMARALGGWGERPDAADGVAPALARAFSYDGPALVDVVIDRSPVHPAMAFIARMFAPPEA